MYVKMIDETLQIANMPDDQAIGEGYKLAVFAEKPVTEKGYYAESNWTEEAETYTQRWSIVEDGPEPDPDAEEVLAILLGGDSE